VYGEHVLIRQKLKPGERPIECTKDQTLIVVDPAYGIHFAGFGVGFVLCKQHKPYLSCRVLTLHMTFCYLVVNGEDYREGVCLLLVGQRSE
jgi:hypothetical protein